MPDWTRMKIIHSFLSITFLAATLLFAGCQQRRAGSPRILVFTKTAGYYHKSIPVAVKTLQALGAENGFRVDTTSDDRMFTEDTLKKYAAVVFVSTTHEVLNYREQADFERYIQAGGGFVGIHAASDGGYTWPWYGRLVGAYFTEHPAQQNATVVLRDKHFPGFEGLPDKWVRFDEWYNFRNIGKDLHVLITIDESSYHGGTNGSFHPMVWYHNYDGGRAFYMEFGHTDSSYSEPDVRQILLAGIRYAMGNNDRLDYGKATAKRVPAENRFSATLLSRGLDEPTQMAILPNLDILIAERKGPILFYRHGTDTVRQLTLLKVYDKASVPHVNAEEGVLGIAADPHFARNHWVYIYYSPADKVVNRLSRFRFEGDKWDPASEQIILEVPTQRQICCHTGGSIAFDASGNLYLSTGDNSTPFDETDSTGKAYPINTHGYAPLDDRPGHQQYDSRRSAGNTNDLRGKILRIRVNHDGTYSIPSGNLFPPGKPLTKPEIYVMGDRNPYRISIDQHTGYLYWGEVGPDADSDSLDTHGPRGYDEINQARHAGNFGWPFFVGNNYAYHEFNYANGQPGILFDPARPVNDSRNNTGLNLLPPAQPAFIWYPYAAYDTFPILGAGGRCAMAGPVYYAADYPRDTRMPEYYDKKLFIYDWIRGWIMAVTMDNEGNLETIEPFMPHADFHSPIDLKMGPDGHLYVLEYGTGWFTRNPDAGLFRIDFNPGNRAPVVQNFRVSKLAGALPFTLRVSAASTADPDGDPLSYTWHFGNGNKLITSVARATYTFHSPGDYPVSVDVSDNHGASTSSNTINVYAGNEIPRVSIDIEGNRSFYFPGKLIRYRVKVKDREDGSSDQPGFDLSRIRVNVRYLESPVNSVLSSSQLESGAPVSGETLMESLDCKSCHKISEKSIGPAFTRVAFKYKNDPDALKRLPQKIIHGGSGVWGQTAMAAHPNLSLEDARKIVSWVLSLADSSGYVSLPIAGSINPEKGFNLSDQGVFYLKAAYTDKGGPGIQSETGTADDVLRNPYIQAASVDSSGNLSITAYKGIKYAVLADSTGWLLEDSLDLGQISGVEMDYGIEQPVSAGWRVEIRLDSLHGRLIGRSVLGMKILPMKPAKRMISLKILPDGSKHNTYFVFRRLEKKSIASIGFRSFRFVSR